MRAQSISDLGRRTSTTNNSSEGLNLEMSVRSSRASSISMKYSNTCSSVKGVVEILVEEDALSLDGLEAMRGSSMAQASARAEYLLRGMAVVFIQNSAHFLRIPPHSPPGVCSRAIVRRKSLRGSEGSEKSHG